jgi:hypothetical protein
VPVAGGSDNKGGSRGTADTNPRGPGPAVPQQGVSGKRFVQVGEAIAVERRGQRLRHPIEGELTVDPHADLIAAFVELPGVEAAVGWQAQIDAGVMGQIAGVFPVGRGS